MGRADRIAILLSEAALCVTIIGKSCSTNARIGDLNARIDDRRAEVTAQIGVVNARINDLGATLNAHIDDLARP